MSTLLSVKQLVQSLTRAEKRSFKLFADHLEGEKDYMKLYDILTDSQVTIESAKERYRYICPESSINATCNYLYHILIKSLRTLNPQNFAEEQLLNGIHETRILFRKGLVEEGFGLLDKLGKIAKKNEKVAYLVILGKMELDYLTRFQFKGLTENELIKIQSRLRKSLSYELNLADHSALYELLYHRYLLNGEVRSQKDKEKLNDLVVTEMNLAGNTRFQSFDLKKDHLLFQSVYFMMTGDSKSSLGTFYELNGLFEENKQLWNDTPIYYINHLRGILNNLHASRQFKEMDFFIQKLKLLEMDNELLILRQIIYCSELKMAIGIKNYTSAFEMIKINTDLLERLDQLTPTDRAETVLFTSVGLFLQKKYKQAATILGKVIHMEHVQNDQLRRELRLVNLVVHFQLQDQHYLSSEIRSLERELKRSRKFIQTEFALLKMMKKYPMAMNRNAKNKLFEGLLDQLHQLVENPFERHLFGVFDFVEWVNSLLVTEK
jgi:hypothetical protein